jgi:hypothetical protein
MAVENSICQARFFDTPIDIVILESQITRNNILTIIVVLFN